MGPRIPWILKEQWDSVYSSWSDMLVINDILSFMQKQGKFKLWSKHARLRTCIKEITKSRNCNPFFRAGISFISQVSSGDRKQKNDSSTPKFEFYLVPGKPYFECGDYLWGGVLVLERYRRFLESSQPEWIIKDHDTNNQLPSQARISTQEVKPDSRGAMFYNSYHLGRPMGNCMSHVLLNTNLSGSHRLPNPPSGTLRWSQ